MVVNKENLAKKRRELAEKREELAGVLTAISVVSKKLARQLAALEYEYEEKLISDKAEWRDNDEEI